jgi:hypothetical protein
MNRKLDDPTLDAGRCCPPECQGWTRANRLRLGILLFLIGTVWFGSKVDWLLRPWAEAGLLWPSVVIVAGALLLLGVLVEGLVAPGIERRR